MMKKQFLLALSITFLFINCKKNDDVVEVAPEQQEETPETPETKSYTDYPVKHFMWQAMNAYYFWQEDVPNLADSKTDSEETYVSVLETKEDPEDFFFSICNNHINVVGETAVDRFSYLSDNYKDLVQGHSGVSKSNGIEFRLYYFPNSNSQVFGYVRYIIPNSDADGKEIKRGDIFIGVDGTNLNGDNWSDLLFGDNDSYSLNFATLENGTPVTNNKTVSFTKVEGLQENPIAIAKVIETNGIKVGYLLYNQFIADYDEELNEKFGVFKSAGIQELILDFRYNPGGYVSSAIQMASAVSGKTTTDMFLRSRYNSKYQAAIVERDGANSLEVNFVDKTNKETALNLLNLNRVFVITSNGTASSSELVMNGLAPYIDVVQIGEATRGKNEFSATLVDDRENGYRYHPDRESNINPNNQWGLQPLFGRNENADGFSDYTSGLIPDYEISENYGNMGILGEVTEPLLAKTLSVITGQTGKYHYTPEFPVDFITDSKTNTLKSNMMLMDGLINFKINNEQSK